MRRGTLEIGARYAGNGRCAFCVWAPCVESVEVRVNAPEELVVRLKREARGYFRGMADGVQPGARYLYRLDGKTERPDPASRFQPDGVHGPSEVVDENFSWTDQHWFGVPLRDYVIYELHVGTFSAEGTFDSIIPRLVELKDLGITAVELMPVSQFPGGRNWGYDGVFPFAAQNSYGGPAGLKRLVNACHATGLAVVLDVVYNHLGPEGNYLADFAPYFTERYKTPWGRAINFDGPDSDEVRRYFIANALHWQTEFHIDALRLDAVHAICDFSARPFLAELASVTRRRAEELNRRFYLIGESDLNDARLILPPHLNGLDLDAQWSDDFHHALHVLLTEETSGYYADFGGVRPLAKAFRQGYAYDGTYSHYRRRRHGNSSALTLARQFVVCSQNHDQVGNRMAGERLSTLVSFESAKLAAGTVLLSPFIPLLFMGEEYGETAPFQYFVSHSDSDLIEAVRKGRAEEFATFGWQGKVPDPQDEATFQRSKLNPALWRNGQHALLRAFYRELIRLRGALPAVSQAEKGSYKVFEDEVGRTLVIHYPHESRPALLALALGESETNVLLPKLEGSWTKVLASAGQQWGGPGTSLPGRFPSGNETQFMLPGRSLALYQRESE